MDVMMIVLRLIHVVSGVFWAGSVFFAVSFLLPAVRATGPAGKQIMRQLASVQKFPVAIGTSATLTILSGLGLYWHDIKLSAGNFGRSTPGMVYGIGAVCALIAFGFGIGLVGRSSGKLLSLGAAIQAAGGAPTPEQAQTMEKLQGKMSQGMRIAAMLLSITVITMAIARYL
jgi:uncharacterized membrane protein